MEGKLFPDLNKSFSLHDQNAKTYAKTCENIVLRVSYMLQTKLFSVCYNVTTPFACVIAQILSSRTLAKILQH